MAAGIADIAAGRIAGRIAGKVAGKVAGKAADKAADRIVGKVVAGVVAAHKSMPARASFAISHPAMPSHHTKVSGAILWAMS